MFAYCGYIAMDLDPDYYQVLGVTTQFTREEINQMYKRRCLECHPDRQPEEPGAVKTFQLLQEAYAILDDDIKRAQYDRWRASDVAVPFALWLETGTVAHWRTEQKPERVTGATDVDPAEERQRRFRKYEL